MDNRENELCLPTAPLGLSFKSEEFTEDTFSVDQFVSKHRRQTSLEQLRDDLSIYFRVLHSAMVKLINKDYADFVNLSTNLVGLDKSLESVSQPLLKLKKQFTDVQQCLQDETKNLNHYLKEARSLSRRKHLCQSVMLLMEHLEKMEALIQSQAGSGDHAWSPELMERITLHLGQIYFLQPQVQNFQVVKNLWPRIQFVREKFESRLQALLLAEVAGNVQALRRVLRIYGTLGKGAEAESILRTHLVKPYVAKVITPKVFQEEGIKAMYDRVLRFFPEKCPKLLELLTTQRRDQEYVLPLDPVSRALWPEVELGLTGLQMSLLAPGNAEKFHLHYMATSSFLQHLLDLCPDPDCLLQLESFSDFVARWNLSVYFQLRFQEIGGGFESCLASSPLSRAEEGSMFHLTATRVLWSSLESSWGPDVWLEELTPDFWKLTLQLLARYLTWLHSLLQGPRLPDCTQLVLLLADLNNLHTQVPYLFQSSVQPKLEALSCTDMKPFTAGLDSWVESSASLPQQLGESAAKQVAGQCATAFRQVADLPRLYRKTNREVPAKPSTYVETVLSPLEEFLHTCGSLVGPHWRDQWCQAVLADLTSQFHTATADVLTSVKKMEDSLKRLKKEGRASRPNAAGMSDDDKIRLQLALDVEHYGIKVRQLCGEGQSVPGFSDLLSLVNSSRPASC